MPNRIVVRSEVVSANDIYEALNNNSWANTVFPTKQKGMYLCQLVKNPDYIKEN